MRRRPVALVAVLAAFAVGLVAGFVLGGVGPRRDLVVVEGQVHELEEALAETGSGAGLRSPVPGLDRILRAPPENDEEREARRERQHDEARRERARSDGGVRRRRFWDDDGEQEDPLSAFQRAASIQRVRNVQSHAALEQQAGLDEDELAEVDAAFLEMNEALVGYGEELILLALEGERPPPLQLLGITHDVTGILERGQRRLEEIVGPERVGEVDQSALEIWNHVDLDLLEPAARAAVGRSR